VGLLGIAPLALGIRGLLQIVRGRSSAQDTPILAGNLATVAIVTIANGGDNVSVYVLLFRELRAAEIAATIAVFLVLLGALCAVALIVGERAKAILGAMGNTQWVTSIVFIAIGIIVLVRTGAIAHLAELAT
jgi:cadmium resistance protein CadD (predicted permease)